MRFLRYAPRWILTVALCSAAEGSFADAPASERGCLYSVTVDSTKVEAPCAESDPLNIASHPDVRTAIGALGLDSVRIRFKGCANLRFSTVPTVSAAGSARHYVITYPTEATASYLAPITHELAHVLQLESAGGLRELRATLTSKRVELGADFLTGVVFSQKLRHVEPDQFQHNLSLIGLYVELDTDAHGTPSQRAAAFRRGVYFKFDSVVRDIGMASEEFQANIYGQIANL